MERSFGLFPTCRVLFSVGGGVINSPHMSAAKETTLKEVGEMKTKRPAKLDRDQIDTTQHPHCRIEL
jgi:hypothetical protein